MSDSEYEELRRRRQQILDGGGKERVAKHHAQGKMTARERIETLLDPDSFLELEPYTLSRFDTKNKYYGDGVITGFGTIDNRTVYLYAQDFTVNGGTMSEIQSRKICHLMDMAKENKAPVIHLIDSGGARIQEGIVSLAGYAGIFMRTTALSGVVPQISLILGPCAGGAAYSPATTDFIIMTRKKSFMFLTGPDVVESVTGEQIDSETLGGSEVHLAESGLAHLAADSDREALEYCRRLLAYLPDRWHGISADLPADDPIDRMDPFLNSIVPADPAEPYSMHQIVETITDRDSFFELQAEFAPNCIIGFARFNGTAVGIVAQEPSIMAGVMDINSSDKISRFVRTCDCYDIPIVTLVDCPGFLPGVYQEHHGVIRHGAKVLYAYAESTVPKVTVVTRKAYGGAYIVLGSKMMGSDVSFAWPQAEIAVMGPEGAAKILYRKQIEAAQDPDAEYRRLVEEYRKKYLNPFVPAETGFIDDVIEPQETRKKIIKALSGIKRKKIVPEERKHGNMPV
ncbi:MAG TPA: acyl-CoA carboxylase subunit beta [Flexilinea sp.]|nr:acyl-CoA carboxylase subunit beta [Flexilinea sp.]